MRVGKTLLVILAVVVILAVGAYSLRLPLASMALRNALSTAGLTNPEGQVTELSLQRIEITDLAAGNDGAASGDHTINLAKIEVSYDWRTLLSERRVKAVTLGPGLVHLSISEDGKIGLPGLDMSGGSSGGALPFSYRDA